MMSDYLGNFEISEGKEYLTAINFDEFTTFGYNLIETNIPHVSELFQGICRNCVSLTSVHIPKQFEIIPSSMFAGCTSLSSVTIDEGITEIYPEAFEMCVALTHITLPNSLKKEYSAIIGCSSLTSITYPENVKEIDFNDLWYCSNLRTVTFKSKNVVYEKLHYLFKEECQLETLYVQPNLLEKYRNDKDWREIADKIKPIEE